MITIEKRIEARSCSSTIRSSILIRILVPVLRSRSRVKKLPTLSLGASPRAWKSPKFFSSLERLDRLSFPPVFASFCSPRLFSRVALYRAHPVEFCRSTRVSSCSNLVCLCRYQRVSSFPRTNEQRKRK